MFLGVLGAPEASVSYLRGWKRTQWWDGPLTFWDDFTDDGALTSDSPAVSPVGSIAVTQSVPAGGEASVTFLLAWHFPNRTPERCGWPAPTEEDKTSGGGELLLPAVHGRLGSGAARGAATPCARGTQPALRGRSGIFHLASGGAGRGARATSRPCAPTRLSAPRTANSTASRGATINRDAATGRCTHVWNYEQATAFVFPSLARSIRESEFLRNTREDGLMGFRSYLPDGKKIWDKAAADGQMGCLMKLYRDWQLSGDTEWLRGLWPNAKRALEFAWIKGGWDANRDGVAEGVQHNTYDVEFYGPNPLCGVWYLGALRAGEEMARALGDQDAAAEYRRLFENGSKWIDANLFNGEYYIQKVEGRPKEEVFAGSTGGHGRSQPREAGLPDGRGLPGGPIARPIHGACGGTWVPAG